MTSRVEISEAFSDEKHFLSVCDTLFECDANSGKLIWKVSKGKARKGAFVGHFDKHSGYMTTRVNGKKQYVHRLIWAIHNQRMPRYEIDHINRDRSDNRISNLRHVTSRCQAMNHGVCSRNKSGVRGVHWAAKKKRWIVQIKTGDMRISGGSFTCKDDAINKRLILEAWYHRIEEKQ